MLPNVKTGICKLIGQLFQFLLCEQKIPKEGEREGYITESGSFNDLPFQESASVDICKINSILYFIILLGTAGKDLYIVIFRKHLSVRERIG